MTGNFRITSLYSIIFLATCGLSSTSAVACGQEGARIATEARERSIRSLRRVSGAYSVTAREVRRFEEMGEPVEETTYYGTVTTASGRTYRTVHVSDGTILLCSWAFQPRGDANGVFYLTRRPRDGIYRLVHWDGEYRHNQASVNQEND